MRFKRMGLLVLAIGLTLPIASVAALAGAEQTVTVPARTVDINKAGVDELTSVPGIGPVMAQRIIDWRTANGPFQRVEDLMKVKGVGEKKLEKLRPYLKVGRSG